MRKIIARKRIIILTTAILAILVLLAVALANIYRSASPNQRNPSLVISFLGYTNPPGKRSTFALFQIQNQNRFPIRLGQKWSEVEGSPFQNAPVMNPTLPWFNNSGSLSLRRAEALLVAVGEPHQATEDGRKRWRFSMMSQHYPLRQILFDQSYSHPWLLKLPGFTQLRIPLGKAGSTRIVTNRSVLRSDWERS